MKNMRIRIGGACSPAEESVITQREMEAIKWAAETAYGGIRDQYICDESDVFAGYMDAAVFMAQHDAAKACSFICTLHKMIWIFNKRILKYEIIRIHYNVNHNIDKTYFHSYNIN